MSTDRAELEAKVTFLERTLDVFQEAMLEQGRVMSALEQRLERLERRIAEKGEPDIGPHESPPPHY